MMAWNEPGGGRNQNQDPWRGNNNQGPPDLDEVFRNLQNKLNRLFGGGSGRGGNGKGGQGDGGTGAIVVVLAILLVCFWAFQGIYRVEEAEKAVVFKFGKYDKTVGAGLHWNPPIIYQIFKRNTSQINSINQSATVLTEDKNIVDIEIEIQYKIEDPAKNVIQIQDARDSLRQAMESALRHAVGSTVMDVVLTEGRDDIAHAVKLRSQEYINTYNTGILITKVNIEDAHPPDAVKEAFDDVIKAKEDEERFKNEAQAYANGVIPEAEGRAQREIEQANAYREELVARASGEAERFSKLLAEYSKAPEVTRERLYLEAMEEVFSNSSKVLMPGGDQSNQLIYLPIDKIMGSVPTRAASTVEASKVKAPSTSTLRDSTSVDSSRLRRDTSSFRRGEGR